MYYMYSESTTCTVQCICGSGFQKTDDPDEFTISEKISLGLVANCKVRVKKNLPGKTLSTYNCSCL